MPAKRKALSEVNSNKELGAPAAKKASITKGKANAIAPATTENPDTVPKATAPNTVPNKTAIGAPPKPASGKAAPKSVASKAPKIKFSNPGTLGDLPKYVNMAWPKDSDDESDESETDGEDEGDEEKPSMKDKPELDFPCREGEKLTDEMIKRVSDMGYPISEDGLQKLLWLDDEQEKRDPDAHGMYIYNDFAGYGMTEVFANLLRDFNKDIFKKDVSPYKKWAYIEGLAANVHNGMIGRWMMTDDSDAIRDTFDMIGTMLLTSLDMLSEHALLGPPAASPIPNIGIICVLLISFAAHDGRDLDIKWAHEVVRALDHAHVAPPLRKQVSVHATEIEEMREKYRSKEDDESYDGEVNAYTHYQKLKYWTPEDDEESGERIWARWDWKKEYADYRDNHEGGTHYDITKMPRAQRDQHLLSNYTDGDESD